MSHTDVGGKMYAGETQSGGGDFPIVTVREQGSEIEKVHANGYLDLRDFSIWPTERIRQLTDLVERHSPVYDTLHRPVEVTGRVELVRPGGEIEVVTSMD